MTGAQPRPYSYPARRRPRGWRRPGPTPDRDAGSLARRLTPPTHSPWRRRAGLIGSVIALAACGSSEPTTTGAATPVPTPAISTPPVTAATHVAYAALGASETYGVGASPVANAYAYRLRDDLHLSAGSFADTGIPGATLADAYQTELTNALAIQPTVSTVLFGVNDIRANVPVNQFTSDLTDLVTTLRKAGSHVLIIGLPDLTHFPALHTIPAAELTAITTRWNRAMQDVATRTGAGFLDLTPFTTSATDVAPDGLHPSNQGHARLAAAILAALKLHGYVPL